MPKAEHSTLDETSIAAQRPKNTRSVTLPARLPACQKQIFCARNPPSRLAGQAGATRETKKLAGPTAAHRTASSARERSLRLKDKRQWREPGCAADPRPAQIVGRVPGSGAGDARRFRR